MVVVLGVWVGAVDVILGLVLLLRVGCVLFSCCLTPVRN